MSIISDSLKRIKPSPTIAVTQKARELRAAGKDVIGLGAGEPDFDTPDNIKEAAIKAIKDGDTKYTAVDGTPTLKQAIVDKFKRENNLNYTTDQITVGAGGKHVIYNLMMATLNKGDEVIIPEPFYANYNGFASAASVSVVPVISEFHSQFQLPALENISEKITAKTRAILLCNPSNPTGYVYSKKEINTLCELAIKHDIFLIVDEVYREFIHGGEPHYSVLSNEKASQHTLMIDSVSKRYSMCGARVGSLVSRNTSLIKNVLKP